LAVGFLVFLLGRFNVDLTAAKNQIQSANPFIYLAAFATYYSSFIVRGIRWRIIAANSGIGGDPGTTLPRISECVLLTVVGWFGNAVTILRVGSAYRAYLFAKASNTTFSQSLGIFLAERVVDGVVIFILMLTASLILILVNSINLSGSFLIMSTLIVIIGVGFIWLMGRFGLKIGGILPPRLRVQYGRFHRGTIGGLQRLPILSALSAVGWILEAGRLLLVIQSLGLSLNMPLAMFVAVVNGVLTMLPFTPGGLGVVEPGVAGVLLVRLSPTSAISVAVLDRSISFLSVILIGAVLVSSQRLWLRLSEPLEVERKGT
jgi:uncharacterized membrane protein YbhN (UPF0104 family)